MRLKRSIALSAELDSTGYGVCVKINGTSFAGRSKSAGGWKNVLQDIYGKLQAVYGERELFEQYVEYQDILRTMRTVGEIVKNMDRLYSRSYQNKEGEQ